MNSRYKYVVVTSSTVLVAVLLLGSVVGKGAGPEDPYRHLAVFSEVLSRIKSDYVEQPDLKTVTLGALNGLLESVDPFASYMSADQYKQWLKNKDTHKGDVGLLVSKRYGYIGVVDAIPGSPADKAGLGTHDLLESIRGVSTRDMPLAFAEMLLRGEPGTSVELSVLRVRKPEPQKMALTRAEVKLPDLTARMLENEIGHLQVQSMEAGKAAHVANTIRSLEGQGAKKIVLDLRDAAYGTPEEGIELANLFLDKGTITYLQGQKVSRQNFQATADKSQFKMPVVVITNRGTANGAEIAAAALLDNKRAEVVGERTYGDAALRKTVTMDDGSAIILSVAKYHSPGGKAIQDNGVTPSVPMVESDAAEEPEDETVPRTEPAPPQQDEDTLLKKAVEVLTKGVDAANKQQARGARRLLPESLMNVTPLGVPQPEQQ